MPGTVGFIGLGAMGDPMALNLIKRGFSAGGPRHRSRKAERCARARRHAGAVAPRRWPPRPIGRSAWWRPPRRPRRCIAGEHGIIQRARAGHIVACMSTIDPLVARRLGEQLAARGIAMVDAPVSGGTERAASGELSIIVRRRRRDGGGLPRPVRRHGQERLPRGRARAGARHEAREQHADPGQHGRDRGGPRAGREGRARPADDLRRGARQHRHQLRVRDARRRGSSSATSRRAAPWTSRSRTRSWRPPFAKQLGVPVLLANVTQQVYQMARAAGLNKEDGSAVMKIYERLAGVTVEGRA